MLIRHAGEEGLIGAYRHGDELVRSTMRTLLGLPLVPHDQLPRMYFQFRENVPRHGNDELREALERMLAYMDREHFGAQWRIARLNAYDTPPGLPRTTNPAEAYHHALYQTFHAEHPTLARLMHELTTNDHLADIRRRRLLAGADPRPRNRRYVNLDARIRQAIEDVQFDVDDIFARGGDRDELQQRLQRHARHCSHLLGGAEHAALVGDQQAEELIDLVINDHNFD